MAGKLRARIGKNIRMFRKKAGMTQVELATKLGYTSTGTLSQIESGSRGMDFDKLESVAKIFKVDVPVLLAPEDLDEIQVEDLRLFYSIQRKAKHGNREAKFIADMIHDLLRKLN